MNRYEYMKMTISIFPQHVIEEYNLLEKVYTGCMWIEISRSIYGLPQFGKLANKYLQKKIAPMDIMMWNTLQDFGSTSHAQYNSPW